MNSESEKLIDSLCQDLAPVKRLWSPSKRAFLWLVFCFALSISFVLLSGELREGYYSQLSSSPRFFAETALGFLSGIVAAFFAFEMMVPGRNWNRELKALSILPFILFTLMILYSIIDPPVIESWSGWRFGCERDIIFYGSIPMLAFFLLAKRAAPIENEWTGMLIGIAALAPSAALMQLACMYQPWHLLGFHVAPVILVALLSVYLARKTLKI